MIFNGTYKCYLVGVNIGTTAIKLSFCFAKTDAGNKYFNHYIDITPKKRILGFRELNLFCNKNNVTSSVNGLQSLIELKSKMELTLETTTLQEKINTVVAAIDGMNIKQELIK